MRNIIFIFLLWAGSTQAQTIAASTITYNSLADLKANTGIDRVPVLLGYLNTLNDGNGGVYMWQSTSTATADDFTVVKPTSVTTGRWIRQLNANTLKGTVTLSGTILQTAYPISFPATLPAIPAIVIIQAYSANAAVPSWVSNVTTTGFTANFTSVPVLGTNNITINYLIIKQ